MTTHYIIRYNVVYASTQIATPPWCTTTCRRRSTIKMYGCIAVGCPSDETWEEARPIGRHPTVTVARRVPAPRQTVSLGAQGQAGLSSGEEEENMSVDGGEGGVTADWQQARTCFRRLRVSADVVLQHSGKPGAWSGVMGQLKNDSEHMDRLFSCTHVVGDSFSCPKCVAAVGVAIRHVTCLYGREMLADAPRALRLHDLTACRAGV